LKNAAQPVPNSIKSRVLRKLAHILLGPHQVHAYRVAQFRMAGEIHRWMYDRYSLASALVLARFASPRQVQAAESSIPEWSRYNLDTHDDGTVYKPDSLYMEASRP
jgi:hypothetical protein